MDIEGRAGMVVGYGMGLEINLFTGLIRFSIGFTSHIHIQHIYTGLPTKYATALSRKTRQINFTSTFVSIFFCYHYGWRQKMGGLVETKCEGGGIGVVARF